MNPNVTESIAPPSQSDSSAPARRGGWRLPTIAFVLALVAAGIVGGRWYYLQRITNWGVVEPGKLYRSALVPKSMLRDKLEDNKIAMILNLSNSTEGGEDLVAEKRLAQEMHISRRDLPLNGDGLGNPMTYADAITAIFQANGRGEAVLVHCHSGAQRTGGVIATYRILVEKMPPGQAYAEMLHYGYDPKGNPQLIPFLNKNMAGWATELRNRNVIDRVPATIPQIVP